MKRRAIEQGNFALSRTVCIFFAFDKANSFPCKILQWHNHLANVRLAYSKTSKVVISRLLRRKCDTIHSRTKEKLREAIDFGKFLLKLSYAEYAGRVTLQLIPSNASAA